MERGDDGKETGEQHGQDKGKQKGKQQRYQGQAASGTRLGVPAHEDVVLLRREVEPAAGPEFVSALGGQGGRVLHRPGDCLGAELAFAGPKVPLVLPGPLRHLPLRGA